MAAATVPEIPEATSRATDLTTAGFLGRDDRRAFGLLTMPSGPVRGAVLICPPLGYEAVCAAPSLRRLAETLAGRGFVVLRIDYPGTDNAPGTPTDPGLVDRWLGAIDDALGVLAAGGLDEVTVLGIRMGATLAANAAAASAHAHRQILWDPVPGRHFVRRMRLFAAAGSGPRADPNEAGGEVDGIVTGGIQFTEETLAGLSRLKVPAPVPEHPRLVVVPSELPGATAPEDGSQAILLPGTSTMLDETAETARIPGRILDAIADWEGGMAEAGPLPRPTVCLDETTTETVDGTTVLHRVVRVGPDRLFAVVSQRADAIPAEAVVMINNGVSTQVGPGRAWVEWGRALAADGMRVVRADLSGIGESGDQPFDTPVVYPVTAGRDIRNLVDDVRADGATSVALMGLCSGTLLAFDGLKAGADLDAIVGINGRFDMPWTDPRPARGLRAAGQSNRLVAIPLHKSPLLPLFARVPRFVWWLLDKLHLHASPSRALHLATRSKARSLLIFGPGEWGLDALRRRTGDFDDLMADEHLDMVEVEGLDHSMFNLRGRSRAFEVVREFLGEALGRPDDTES